jgi:hypothetical protein
MERALFNLRVKIQDAEAVYNFIAQACRPVRYSEILGSVAKDELTFKCNKCFKKFTAYEALRNNFICPECRSVRLRETIISEVLSFLELLSFIKKIDEGNDPLFALHKTLKYPFNFEVLKSITNLEERSGYNHDYKQALRVCLENDGEHFKSPQEFAIFLNANIYGRTVLINKNKAENWLLLFSELGVISRLGSSYIICIDPEFIFNALKIYSAESNSGNNVKLELFLKFLQQFLPIEGRLPNTVVRALQTLERMQKIDLVAAPDDTSRKYLFDDGRYVREVIIKC